MRETNPYMTRIVSNCKSTQLMKINLLLILLYIEELLTGALQYVTITRVVFAYFANKLNHYMKAPTCKYVKGCSSFSMEPRIMAYKVVVPLILEGYTNVD